jgi:excisionase family DNA binding protein
MTDRELELRGRLEAVLSPELVATLLELVDEHVAAAPPADTRSPWYRIDEAAEYLRVSERTIEREIAKGRLPSFTIGRPRLVHRDHLDALAATGEDVAPTTPPRRRGA